MASKTIDESGFQDLKDTAGDEFVDELVDTFPEEAPVLLHEMQTALMAGDTVKLRRAAHSLKSNDQTFGGGAAGIERRRPCVTVGLAC